MTHGARTNDMHHFMLNWQLAGATWTFSGLMVRLVVQWSVVRSRGRRSGLCYTGRPSNKREIEIQLGDDKNAFWFLSSDRGWVKRVSDECPEPGFLNIWGGPKFVFQCDLGRNLLHSNTKMEHVLRTRGLSIWKYQFSYDH